MKINWKVRLSNKTFLTSLIALILLLAKEIASLFGVDTTIYTAELTSILNTILAILVLMGVVVDPTTGGINDSERALSYEKPKDEPKGND